MRNLGHCVSAVLASALRNPNSSHYPNFNSALNGVSVTGALCRKTDPKIATVPKTQSRSKDQNKDKDNSK